MPPNFRLARLAKLIRVLTINVVLPMILCPFTDLLGLVCYSFPKPLQHYSVLLLQGKAKVARVHQQPTKKMLAA
jgi:hypothetical protein